MNRFRSLAPLVVFCAVAVACLCGATAVMAQTHPGGPDNDVSPATLAVIVVGAIGLVGNLGGFTMIKWSVEQIVEQRANRTEAAFRDILKGELLRNDEKLAAVDNHYDAKVATAFKRIDELRGELIDLRTCHEVLHGERSNRPVSRPGCHAPESDEMTIPLRERP